MSFYLLACLSEMLGQLAAGSCSQGGLKDTEEELYLGTNAFPLNFLL